MAAHKTLGLKRAIAAVITITSVVVFTSVLVHAAFYAPDSEQTTVDQHAAFKDSGLSPGNVSAQAKLARKIVTKTPRGLQVESVGIDTDVQAVGIAQSGHMAVPTNYTSVGWYKYGAEPGKSGTAVVDGHLDNGLGLHGVFWNLDKIVRGNKIQVIDSSGKNFTYMVTRTDSFDFEDPRASAFIFQNESTPTLRLVTCSGDWEQASRTYNKRFVVTATLST